MKTKSSILVHTDAIAIEMRDVRKSMAGINPKLELYQKLEKKLELLKQELFAYRELLK